MRPSKIGLRLKINLYTHVFMPKITYLIIVENLTQKFYFVLKLTRISHLFITFLALTLSKKILITNYLNYYLHVLFS